MNIKFIWNPAWSPEYQPIESAIGLAKTWVKMKRWNALQNNEDLDIQKLVVESFQRIDKVKIVNFINRSNILLKELK